MNILRHLYMNSVCFSPDEPAAPEPAPVEPAAEPAPVPAVEPAPEPQPEPEPAPSAASALSLLSSSSSEFFLPLWTMALSSLPVGATGRVIAALAGLPPYAAVAVAVTLLLAVAQVLAGAWLARAVLPARSAVPPAPGAPDPGDPRT